MNGNKDIVIYLVEKGIDIIIKNQFNKTAGEEACERGFSDISEYLIEKELVFSNDLKNLEVIEGDNNNNIENDNENCNDYDEEDIEMKITEKDLEENK